MVQECIEREIKERKRRSMKKVKQRLLSWILAVAMICAMLPVTALAADGDVARIGDVEYATLDDAVAAAKDGDTIELLKDATTIGLNLSKNLSIQGASDVAEKPTITFTDKGIALWGKKLIFKNCDVVMKGIGSTPYTAEWNWMTICASRDASLELDNVNMLMDAAGTSNSPHAIYFCYNNILNVLNGSTLTIKNYKEDALEWDGGDEGYNVNIKDSKFISDHNRSGFAGTFYATIENSNVDVINSLGNGSNGSHFIIRDSIVNFNDNGSHGLSTGNLTITDSTVVADRNGCMGIAVGGNLKIEQDSVVTITGNAFKSNAGYAAMRLYNDKEFNIDSTSKLYINDNFNTGLYVRMGNLTVEEGAVLEITGNKVTNNLLDGYGGGLYVGYDDNYDPVVTLPSNAVIYNNHSTKGGDDIYVSQGINGPSLTFGTVGKGWALDGEPDCEDLIDGWYDDAEDARWKAHEENEDDNHIEEFADFSEGLATVTGLTYLKAAHGVDAQSKTSLPGLEKWILQGDKELASDSVAARDEITFELKSNVPENLLEYIDYPVDDPGISTFALGEMDGENPYILTFHDVMDPALVLDGDSFVVKIGDKELTEDQYEFVNDPVDGCDFEIKLNLSELYNNDVITESDLGSTAIIVTYKASLSEDATAGSYLNTAWVSYLEDESAPDIVTVRTYGINIFKFDSVTNRGLKGAQFTLTDADGNEIGTVESGDDGYVRIDGLDEGTYKLTEIEAPDGYVKSDVPLEINITVSADRYNVVNVRFANTPIPHTGGTGTRMYTIAGAAIVLGAGALLVVSRRKKEDK